MHHLLFLTADGLPIFGTWLLNFCGWSSLQFKMLKVFWCCKLLNHSQKVWLINPKWVFAFSLFLVLVIYWDNLDQQTAHAPHSSLVKLLGFILYQFILLFALLKSSEICSPLNSWCRFGARTILFDGRMSTDSFPCFIFWSTNLIMFLARWSMKKHLMQSMRHVSIVGCVHLCNKVDAVVDKFIIWWCGYAIAESLYV